MGKLWVFLRHPSATKQSRKTNAKVCQEKQLTNLIPQLPCVFSNLKQIEVDYDQLWMDLGT